VGGELLAADDTVLAFLNDWQAAAKEGRERQDEVGDE
jgi:hypothetical protein